MTAGPTREYIDRVRFITNASSGRMGFAIARAAARAGYEVTLICAESLVAGARSVAPDLASISSVEIVPFVSVEDLRRAMEDRFASCDAIIMAAAVGDFRVENAFPGKLSRKAGPFTLRLVPTEDVLAAVASAKRPGQRVIAFAVEEGEQPAIEAKARAEMAAKHADLVVVNTPEAMAAEESLACILSPGGVVLPWAVRPKDVLAREIVKVLGEALESAPTRK